MHTTKERAILSPELLLGWLTYISMVELAGIKSLTMRSTEKPGDKQRALSEFVGDNSSQVEESGIGQALLSLGGEYISMAISKCKRDNPWGRTETNNENYTINLPCSPKVFV